MAIWKKVDRDGEVVAEVDIPDPAAEDDGTVLHVDIKPGIPHHSEIPHPLVTVDFNDADEPIAISFIGPVREAVLNPQPMKSID